MPERDTVEVQFRTVAELQGARELQTALEKQIGAIKAVNGDFSEQEKQLGLVTGALSKHKAAVDASSAAMAGAAASGFGGAVAVGALVAFAAALEKSVEAFAQVEQAVFGLDAALAQQGLLTKNYREQLQGVAAELQNTTAIASEQWLGVLQRLTQFGSKPETIGIDIEAVKNLAGIMGGDLQAAANAYSRALEGQFQGFTRLGIKIDENLTQSEKLNQLQRELAEKGGGQLEARAKSLTGQFTSLRNAIGDVAEDTGNMISRTGILQSVMSSLTSVVQVFGSALSVPVEKLEGLANNANAAATAQEKAATATKNHTTALKEMEKATHDADRAKQENLQDIDEQARNELEVLRAQKANALKGADPAQRAAIEDQFAGREQAVREGARRRAASVEFESHAAFNARFAQMADRMEAGRAAGTVTPEDEERFAATREEWQRRNAQTGRQLGRIGRDSRQDRTIGGLEAEGRNIDVAQAGVRQAEQNARQTEALLRQLVQASGGSGAESQALLRQLIQQQTALRNELRQLQGQVQNATVR